MKPTGAGKQVTSVLTAFNFDEIVPRITIDKFIQRIDTRLRRNLVYSDS
jgi:hypothetical protein